MPRYVAFLRGVSPLNARMPELKRAFEAAGFTNVRTVLSSGNVVFDSRARSIETLQQRAEAAMQTQLGRSFSTIVRSAKHLQALIESEPFAKFKLPPAAKCVVTFMRRPSEVKLALPIERDQASILEIAGKEVYSAYVPSARGAVFMGLLERTFGTEITTRTLETVKRCAWV